MAIQQALPTFERICAAEGCENIVVGRSDKRYCCRRCNNLRKLCSCGCGKQTNHGLCQKAANKAKSVDPEVNAKRSASIKDANIKRYGRGVCAAEGCDNEVVGKKYCCSRCRYYPKLCPCCGKQTKRGLCKSMASKAVNALLDVKAKKSVASKKSWKHKLGDKPRQKEYTYEFKAMRPIIRARDKVCLMCGEWERSRRPENHHVHHIDFDKSNNDPHNLCLLCSSCHARVTQLGSPVCADPYPMAVVIYHYLRRLASQNAKGMGNQLHVVNDPPRFDWNSIYALHSLPGLAP